MHSIDIMRVINSQRPKYFEIAKVYKRALVNEINKNDKNLAEEALRPSIIWGFGKNQALTQNGSSGSVKLTKQKNTKLNSSRQGITVWVLGNI